MAYQEIISFTHSYVHDKLPKVFKNFFNHRHDLSQMITEPKKRRFNLPIFKPNIGASTVTVVGSKAFVEKEMELKWKNSMKTFRKNIKCIYLPYRTN